MKTHSSITTQVAQPENRRGQVKRFLLKLRALNYSDANHTIMLLSYLAQAVALCLLVNPLHDLLYDHTIDYIRWLQPRKTPALDYLMYAFSIIGEADNLFLIIVLIWALNYNSKSLTQQYAVNYLSISLVVTTVMMFFLKPLFGHSRPFLDDISIADTYYLDCPGEFGSPSGHALNTTAFLLVLMWFYFEKYAE